MIFQVGDQKRRMQIVLRLIFHSPHFKPKTMLINLSPPQLLSFLACTAVAESLAAAKPPARISNLPPTNQRLTSLQTRASFKHLSRLESAHTTRLRLLSPQHGHLPPPRLRTAQSSHRSFRSSCCHRNQPSTHLQTSFLQGSWHTQQTTLHAWYALE